MYCVWARYKYSKGVYGYHYFITIIANKNKKDTEKSGSAENGRGAV
jgi:hypothetical protein